MAQCRYGLEPAEGNPVDIFLSSWILIDSSNPQLRLRRQISPMLAAEGGSPGTVNQGKRICPDNVSWLQLSRLTFLGAREGEVRLKISRRLGSAMRGTDTPDQGRRTLDQARTTIWTPPRRTSTLGPCERPKVGLKSCIVPINFPHGEVLSRSRAVTNAAIHIFSFKRDLPAPLKDRSAYSQGSYHPLCPPACVSVSTFPAMVCLIFSKESDHKPRS